MWVKAKCRSVDQRYWELDRQPLESDRRHWEKRVSELEQEILREPERIQQTYQVKAERIEPVGVVYLWPVSN